MDIYYYLGAIAFIALMFYIHWHHRFKVVAFLKSVHFRNIVVGLPLLYLFAESPWAQPVSEYINENKAAMYPTILFGGAALYKSLFIKNREED